MAKLSGKQKRAIQQATAQQQVQQRSQIVASVAMSGPLPPPQQLAGYEAVLPGCAERIIRMAEEQAAHRRALETKGLEHLVNRSTLGLTTARNIQIVFLGASFVLIVLGHDAAGAALGTLDLAGIATIYIYGSASSRNERLQRAKIMTGQDND